MQELSALIAEFQRIGLSRKAAQIQRSARVCLGPSVTRVFSPGTGAKLTELLQNIPVDELIQIQDQAAYKLWFERHLSKVAELIRKTCSPKKCHVYPGHKWGHGTKVLCLFVRDIVLLSRYFDQEQTDRLANFLYVPIDSIVMQRLTCLGYELPFAKIREIDSAAKFYGVQELLKRAATAAGVASIHFDDVWGTRPGQARP